MTNNDTSDEACEQWICDQRITVRFVAQRIWQECRRRCEVQMEELRETIQGQKENLDHYRNSSKQWMEAYQKLNAQATKPKTWDDVDDV